MRSMYTAVEAAWTGLRAVLARAATATPGRRATPTAPRDRLIGPHIHGLHPRTTLRVERRGDWNDQLLTKIAEDRGAAPYYLEVRNTFGQLVKVYACDSLDDAEGTINRLKTNRIYRLVDNRGRLITWRTRIQ